MDLGESAGMIGRFAATLEDDLCGAASFLGGNNFVHELGQPHIALRDTAAVMGGQGHVDAVVNIAPFRMVIHLFGHEGHPAHKPEGRVEIGEFKAAPDGVAAWHLFPEGQLFQRRGTGRWIELLKHEGLLVQGHATMAKTRGLSKVR